MGFFDATSASLFRKSADGRTLFRPFGKRGGTYLVSDERAEELRAWQRRFFIVAFVAIVVLVQLWQYRVLWATPLFVAVLCVKYWHFTRTLPRTDDEPVAVSRSEMLTAQANAVGTRVLLPVAIGSALFFAAGVWMCVAKPGRDAYMVAGFFGLCTMVNGWQYLVARRNDH
jgi:hypothetical protein